MQNSSLEFKDLGVLGKRVLEMTKSGETFSLVGLPGCGRGRILNLLWEKYQEKGVTLVVVSADEIKRFSQMRSDSFFAQARTNKGYVPLMKFSDFRSLLTKSKRLIMGVYFFENLQENEDAQKFFMELNQEYENKIQFVIDSNVQLLTDPYKFRFSSSVSLHNVLIVDQYPERQIRRIIDEQNKDLEKGQKDTIVQISGGNPGLAKYITRSVTPQADIVRSALADPNVLARIADLDAVIKDCHVTLSNNTFIANVGRYNFKLPLILKDYLESRKSLESYLSQSEVIIYSLLNKNKGQYSSKEDLAKQLWDDKDDKYSEWAIYKIMQGLKRKISKHSTDLTISVSRGRGYVLHSKRDTVLIPH